MDHNEVREILEDAAIEPGGLERLMAGDTPTASIVAGHLAGCPDCAEELERLRRTVGLIAPAVRAVPPPELRERTLAFVAAVGRPRGGAAAGSADRASAPAGVPALGRSGPIPTCPTAARPRHPRPRHPRPRHPEPPAPSSRSCRAGPPLPGSGGWPVSPPR